MCANHTIATLALMAAGAAASSAAAAASAAGATQAAQPFTVQDLVSLDRISDPAVSPDGKRVAYTLRTTDLEANKGRTAIWLLETHKRNVAGCAPHGFGREFDIPPHGAPTAGSSIISPIAAVPPKCGA